METVLAYCVLLFIAFPLAGLFLAYLGRDIHPHPKYGGVLGGVEQAIAALTVLVVLGMMIAVVCAVVFSIGWALHVVF